MPRFFPGKTAAFLLFLALAAAPLHARPSFAASVPKPPKDAGETTSCQVLDGRTAIRWDPVFFAWAVHYPESIVPLWVREKNPGKTTSARDLARSYRSALKLDDSTPVLFSVFAYTGNPVRLKPIATRLFLRRTAGKDVGKKIPPRRADPVFDQPFSGLKQGLIFFPKTPEPFELVLERPGKSPLVFSFREDLLRAQQAALTEKARIDRFDAVEKERKKWEARVSRLEREIARLTAEREETKPEALFEDRLRQAPETGNPQAGRQAEAAAGRFFEAWKKGNPALMQSLLAEPLWQRFPSGEAMTAFLRKKALPERLPNGATLEPAAGAGRFRITLTTKVLLVRDVRRFFFSVGEAKGSWWVTGLE
ncbi:MAG: hypothetical protein ACC613_03960 [Synergistales bacterium]